MPWSGPLRPTTSEAIAVKRIHWSRHSTTSFAMDQQFPRTQSPPIHHQLPRNPPLSRASNPHRVKDPTVIRRAQVTPAKRPANRLLSTLTPKAFAKLQETFATLQTTHSSWCASLSPMANSRSSSSFAQIIFTTTLTSMSATGEKPNGTKQFHTNYSFALDEKICRNSRTNPIFLPTDNQTWTLFFNQHRSPSPWLNRTNLRRSRTMRRY